MNTLQATRLIFVAGSSDKFYHIRLDEEDNGTYSVPVNYGRNGQTGLFIHKAKNVSLETATKTYNKIIKQKMDKGYWEDSTKENVKKLTTKSAVAMVVVNPLGDELKTASSEKPQSGNYNPQLGTIPQLLNEIEEPELQALLNDPDWWAQEKHDGKRMMLHYDGETGILLATNRKGKECGCPGIYLAGCKTIADNYAKTESFSLDGESVGNIFYVFDIIEFRGNNRKNQIYEHRYNELRALLETHTNLSIKLVQTAKTSSEKKALLKSLKEGKKEGIVFKKKTAKYQSGRPNSGGDQLKFKFYDTCSCIVDQINTKRSISLRLSDKDIKVPVGNCTIPPNKEIPKAGEIVEIKYLYAYKGGSLYQPIYIGVRDDLESDDCKLSQLKYKNESGPVEITSLKEPALKRKVLWQ